MKVRKSLKHKHQLLIELAVILIFSGLLATHAAAALTGNSSVIYLQPEGKNLILNDTVWIILDPVSDRITGENVTLSGMTNLPAGTEIEIGLTEPGRQADIPDDIPVYYSGSGLARVTNGSIKGNNLFSAQADTSAMKQGEYRITVSSENITGYIPGPLLLFPGSSKGTVTDSNPGYYGSNINFWLSIDSSPARDENTSTYTITGTTNLPVGENLSCTLFEIGPIPSPGQERMRTMNLPKKVSPYKGHVVYRKGGEPNEFMLRIDESELPAGTNRVTIWNPRYNSSDPNSFLSGSIDFREESNTMKSNSTTSWEENRTILIRNGSTWIRSKINCDRGVGEVFNITGTTNLQPGEYLTGIFNQWGSPLIVNTIMVENGTTPGENTFSFRFDTGEFSSGECQFHLVSPKVEGTLNSFVLFGNNHPERPAEPGIKTDKL